MIEQLKDVARKVQATLEFEGGDPGYRHGWVSWLFHGKMHDWKRIDEAFHTEEGDGVLELGRGLQFLKG